MSTVLAALDSNATSSPVLGTAVAVAFMFGATVIALHVRENGTKRGDVLVLSGGHDLVDRGAPLSSRSSTPAARASSSAARGGRGRLATAPRLAGVWRRLRRRRRCS